MSWYRKSRSPMESFISHGFEFGANIYGKFHRATQTQPAEYPEVEILKAEVSDIGDLYSYVEFIEDNFYKEIYEEVESRLSNFGVITNPISFEINGVRFVLNIVSKPPYDDWEIIDADIIDEDTFLSTLPEKIQERVEEGILSREQSY